MTGRGMGFCAGYDAPGFATAGPGVWGAGRGWGGRGAGGGFGRRNRFYATGLTGWQRAQRGMQAWGGMPPVAPSQTASMTDADRLAELRAQADRLEQQLSGIRDELASFEDK